MMKVALDTNCFIDAENPRSHNHTATRKLFSLCEDRRIDLYVSRHTLAELEARNDPALQRALHLPILPYYPVGSWDDVIGTWDDLAGTWDDAKRNQLVQQELQSLAKAGTDIRNRGAYIDALTARVDAFVTSDKQLVASGPANRIEQRFGLRVVTPSDVLANLNLKEEKTV
jgi:predicted nucleic acid-binding protein